MNSSGIVLVLAGVWVCTQILGGEALARLGVGNDISAQAGTTGGSTSATPGMTIVDRSATATVGGGTWA